MRVTVYDGKSHPVDSKDVAFVSAGRKAFLDALAKARPIVLEPIVNVEITAPEERMGDIAGELSGHRGHIKGSDAPRPGLVQITAQAPLSELEHFPGAPEVAHRRATAPTTWNSATTRRRRRSFSRSWSPPTSRPPPRSSAAFRA